MGGGEQADARKSAAFNPRTSNTEGRQPADSLQSSNSGGGGGAGGGNISSRSTSSCSSRGKASTQCHEVQQWQWGAGEWVRGGRAKGR